MVFVTKLSDHTLHFFEDDDTCFPHRYDVCQSTSQSDTLPSSRRLLKITIEGLTLSSGLQRCARVPVAQKPVEYLTHS